MNTKTLTLDDILLQSHIDWFPGNGAPAPKNTTHLYFYDGIGMQSGWYHVPNHLVDTALELHEKGRNWHPLWNRGGSEIRCFRRP